MCKIAIMFVLLLITSTSSMVVAQQKCEGPPELCNQILQLQAELNAQKEKTVVVQQGKTSLEENQKKQEERALEFIGIMGTTAVILKIILSLLTTWKDTLFQNDKGKAIVRIAILTVTLLIFLTTNMGFGIPWWQALILAAGGPLSMIIHEMMKLIPVIRGSKKLPPDNPVQPSDPVQPGPTS